MSGRGTSGGVVFQSEVGASLVSLLLTERPMSRLGSGLPGTPKRLFFEAASAVDDILVETDCGHIYIQAKRTISLSKSATGELASVAEQFVRQFRVGTIEGGIKRDMALSRDRLILAVGDETPNTVAINLQQALERNRTGSATAIPEHLLTALETFSDLIDVAWLDQTANSITQTDRQAVLSLCTVIKIGESQRQLTVEILQNVVARPGDETALYGLLVKWAADASQSGVGGDAEVIRNYLQSIFSLKEAPSFREDVNKLSSYSTAGQQRLKRFTELSTPDGNITISRPVVDVVIKAVKRGSLVITGEPGAGKSAIISQVAEVLAKEAKVIVLSVEAGSISLDALRQDIRLEHPLIEVLRQMSGNKLAYLLLDALDAVRGGLAEQSYKKLIQEVVALSGWRVVASVRTFDLRLGKDWRALFAGPAPEPDYSDENLPNVRHIHIGLLDNQERADIALKSPRLSQAIEAAGPRMVTLTQNPFNLGLVADLLKIGLPPESLALVKTRGQLLETYWQERITELGTPATVALKRVVSLMIDSRSIDLPETEIPMETAATVDNLQQVGVLTSEPTRRIGFRHHVLFDYAVARLILMPDRSLTVRLFSKDKSIGLLISPSLGYWLEELKENLTATEYWTFVTSVISDKNIDPIIRVEFARLTVESVSNDESLTPLANVLKNTNPHQSRALMHLVGSLSSKASSKQLIFTEPWAGLVSKLDKPTQEQLGSLHVLIGLLLNYENSSNALVSLGVASRTLFDAMSSEEHLIPRLAPYVIKYVTQTYETDPVASRHQLEKIFSEKRFKQWGHIEAPNLAREIMSFAGSDADFVVQIYYRIFLGGYFSRDHVTAMSNSWILPINSNAAQDFSMAEHSLSHAFSSLITEFPRTAVRAFASTLHGEFGRHTSSEETKQVQTLRYDETDRVFEEDNSYSWAWNVSENLYRDNYAIIYQSFISWASAINDAALLREIPSLVFQETGIALAWKALFEVGALKPDTLGIMLWQSAGDSVALISLDTRQAAISLLAAVYPHLSITQCRQTEADWLQIDCSKFQNPEKVRRQILGTLFESIGEEQLATEEARVFLRTSRKDGNKFINSKPFNIETSWESDDRHWLEHEGVNINSEEVAPLIVLSNSVKLATKTLENDDSLENGMVLLEAVIALDAASKNVEEVVDTLVEQEVSATLAEGLGTILFRNYAPISYQQEAIKRLLEITYHDHPQLSEDTEENFARTPMWGSPAPRIKAAEAITKLASNPAFWPLIQDRFESLLIDELHPAVRLQLAMYMPWVKSADIGIVWGLILKFLKKEGNISVLTHGLNGLARIINRDDLQLEPYLIDLVKKIPSPKSGDDVLTGLIMFYSIHKNLAASNEIVKVWIADYASQERRLRSAIFDIRNNLTLGFNDPNQTSKNVRDRSINFIWSLIGAIEPAVRSWPSSGREPTTEEKTALQLFISIGDQFYYAAGHSNAIELLETDSAKRQFLKLYSPLISKLTTLGTPGTIHHMLELLEKLVRVEPELCFDLISEALLRTTGVAQYQYESMGATRFVELVSLYLADYRHIFADSIRTAKLISCLEIFVEAGWPEARKLFQNLQDLI